MNVTKTPNIGERSFTRRFTGVKNASIYITDLEMVDAGKKVFEADDDLEDKLEAGDAVWCYLRLYLFPWI